ncbi:hypothetical protein ABPG74_002902 [Tetrahymena malaccensis]
MEESSQGQNQDINQEVQNQQNMDSAIEIDQFTMSKVNVVNLKQKVIIRCTTYMIDNLFALTDDFGNVSIYDAANYEISEFQNQYISQRVVSYSLRFYQNYAINKQDNQPIHVMCQCLFNNMIIFWNISHFMKTKQLTAYKILFTAFHYNYDSVLLPDYNLIAVTHQNQKMLAFYCHNNNPGCLINKKISKVILNKQFDQQIFTIQYDRRRKIIYVGLINAQILFYDMRLRRVTQIITPQANNRYSFDSILIPRQSSIQNISEESINAKMVDQEYDFEYLIISTDSGLMCINLDQQCICTILSGHTNQTRGQAYHKESNSIFSISCDKRIGIHPLSSLQDDQNSQNQQKKLNMFRETQLKGLCNSISLHNEHIIVVSWSGEIGHYNYKNYYKYQQSKLEEIHLLTQQYQKLQELIKENIYLKSLQQQNQQEKS